MQAEILERPGKPKLSYIYTPAKGKGAGWPLVMFLGGFRSDMSGTKATYFEAKCRERGQAYLRLDYSGHGLSEGKFEEGTISRWKEDALAVLDHVTGGRGPVVLVGSSMGGWIALLAAIERAGQVTGLVGIAAAPDFTEWGVYKSLGPEEQKMLETQGFVSRDSAYGDPYIYTKALVEDGRKNFVLNKEHTLDIPMRIVQGQEDAEVPWRVALEIEKAFTRGDVDVILIDDGDHRLSRPEDLELIDREIKDLSGIF